RTTLGSAFRASIAAAVPRPPQPINPTFKVLEFSDHIPSDAHALCPSTSPDTEVIPAAFKNFLLEKFICYGLIVIVGLRVLNQIAVSVNFCLWDVEYYPVC